MFLYQLGNKAYRLGIPLVPRLMDILIRLVHNSAVFSQTQIGENTIFAYGGIGVVIHKRAIIGENCNIGSNVTIGGKSHSENVPVIGDNVFIATGAKILGSVKIGNNSVIGANAVVLEDIPDNCVAVGIPAKVIKYNINPMDYY